MNFKCKAWLPIGLLFVLPFATLAADTSKEEKSAVCPVTGEAVDKNVSIDYHGGKLYFCCADCLKKFKDNESKYAAKANLQLVATGQAKQTGCPMTGNPVNSAKSLKVAGVEVKFCSDQCLKKVKNAKPADQIKLVFEKGFNKAYTVNKN